MPYPAKKVFDLGSGVQALQMSSSSEVFAFDEEERKAQIGHRERKHSQAHSLNQQCAGAEGMSTF